MYGENGVFYPFNFENNNDIQNIYNRIYYNQFNYEVTLYS